MAEVVRARTVGVQRHFARFLDNIELDHGRVRRIVSAAQRLAEFCQSDSEIGQYAPHVFFQGSFSIGTAVKPLHARQEYDVDVVVLLSLPNAAPGDVLNWFTRRLRRDADYGRRIRPSKDKCVRLNYAGDFHVDIVPAHRVAGNNGEIQIPSRREGWLYSHPKGYSSWCRRQDHRTGGFFARCVKMLKRWRDVNSETRRSLSSAVLTTLAGWHVPTAVSGETDAFAVAATLASLDSCLQRSPRKPVIPNPSLQGEDLAASWSQAAYVTFRRRVRVAAQVALQAYAARNEYQAARLWRRLFGRDLPLTASDGDMLK